MRSFSSVVLTSPDILREVFSWLNPSKIRSSVDSGERKVLKRTLFSAALVCQAFCPHALDQLWWTLHKLVPLLTLLPPLYFDDDEDSYVSAKYP